MTAAATTSSLAVEASGIWKIFNEGAANEVAALQDVSLTVGAGEFVSLIGPSGCGKSTLLRVIADLTQPTKGDIKVAGLPAPQARQEQRYGMAFQQAALFDWRTVRRNVELPLELTECQLPVVGPVLARCRGEQCHRPHCLLTDLCWREQGSGRHAGDPDIEVRGRLASTAAGASTAAAG